LTAENVFFITGLPRSRTAWLANLLTAAGSFCFHDAVLADGSLDGAVSVMLERLSRRPHESVGDSDSGLLFWADLARKRFPDSPFVIIERDPSACLASSVRHGFSKGLWSAILQAYWQTRRLPGVRIVSYDSLSDLSELEKLYSFCTRLPMDRQRARLLMHLNVQEQLNNDWATVAGNPELHQKSA
jgi:hypothetical protein